MFKLQEKKAMSAYLLKCGLDDQDPEDWDNPDTLLKEGHTLDGLVIPDVDGLTSDEEAGEGEKGDEMEEEVVVEEAHLRMPSPILAFSSSSSSSSEGVGASLLADKKEGERPGGRVYRPQARCRVGDQSSATVPLYVYLVRARPQEHGKDRMRRTRGKRQRQRRYSRIVLSSQSRQRLADTTPVASSASKRRTRRIMISGWRSLRKHGRCSANLQWHPSLSSDGALGPGARPGRRACTSGHWAKCPRTPSPPPPPRAALRP